MTTYVARSLLAHKLARFREINRNQRNVHHDALELPDGKIVLVTKLREGQHLAVYDCPLNLMKLYIKEKAQQNQCLKTTLEPASILVPRFLRDSLRAGVMRWQCQYASEHSVTMAGGGKQAACDA